MISVFHFITCSGSSEWQGTFLVPSVTMRSVNKKKRMMALGLTKQQLSSNSYGLICVSILSFVL